MKITPNFTHYYNTGISSNNNAHKSQNINFTSNPPKHKNRWAYIAFGIFISLPILLLPVFRKLGESRRVSAEQSINA